jgi:hypothetical protein
VHGLNTPCTLCAWHEHVVHTARRHSMNTACRVLPQQHSSSPHLRSAPKSTAACHVRYSLTKQYGSSTVCCSAAGTPGPTNWHCVQGTKPINQCPDKHCWPTTELREQQQQQQHPAAALADTSASQGCCCSLGQLGSYMQSLMMHTSLHSQLLNTQNIHCYKLLTENPARARQGMPGGLGRV